MKLNALIIGLLVALVLLLLPLSAAAVTNPEIIAIYKESIAGLVGLTKLAWRATGVASLC